MCVAERVHVSVVSGAMGVSLLQEKTPPESEEITLKLCQQAPAGDLKGLTS